MGASANHTIFRDSDVCTSYVHFPDAISSLTSVIAIPIAHLAGTKAAFPSKQFEDQPFM
jgi:hypothetical protein